MTYWASAKINESESIGQGCNEGIKNLIQCPSWKGAQSFWKKVLLCRAVKGIYMAGCESMGSYYLVKVTRNVSLIHDNNVE